MLQGNSSGAASSAKARAELLPGGFSTAVTALPCLANRCWVLLSIQGKRLCDTAQDDTFLAMVMPTAKRRMKQLTQAMQKASAGEKQDTSTAFLSHALSNQSTAYTTSYQIILLDLPLSNKAVFRAQRNHF